MKNNNNKKDVIEQIYQLALQEKLEEIEFRDTEYYIRIKRRGKKSNKPGGIFIPHQILQQEPQKESTEYKKIKSPLNGTFYRAPSPESVPYVKEGDVVEAGTVLCLIEAMKVMNEIHAEKKIKIAKILIENGKSVNVDQDMFSIEEV